MVSSSIFAETSWNGVCRGDAGDATAGLFAGPLVATVTCRAASTMGRRIGQTPGLGTILARPAFIIVGGGVGGAYGAGQVCRPFQDCCHQRDRPGLKAVGCHVHHFPSNIPVCVGASSDCACTLGGSARPTRTVAALHRRILPLRCQQSTGRYVL